MARKKTYAHWVAMNLVTELQLTDVWPEPGLLNGEEAMGGRAWYWTVRVLETPDADVRRLDVAVRLDPLSDATVADAVGYVGRPL